MKTTGLRNSGLIWMLSIKAVLKYTSKLYCLQYIESKTSGHFVLTDQAAFTEDLTAFFSLKQACVMLCAICACVKCLHYCRQETMECNNATCQHWNDCIVSTNSTNNTVVPAKCLSFYFAWEFTSLFCCCWFTEGIDIWLLHDRRWLLFRDCPTWSYLTKLVQFKIWK